MNVADSIFEFIGKAITWLLELMREPELFYPLVAFVVLAILILLGIALFIKHIIFKKITSDKRLKAKYWKSGIQRKPKRKLQGVVFGKLGFKLITSRRKDEGNIYINGKPGSGKSQILIATLRAWGNVLIWTKVLTFVKTLILGKKRVKQHTPHGVSFVIDLNGELSASIYDETKAVIAPCKEESATYDVFGIIDQSTNNNRKNELLENLAKIIIPQKKDGQQKTDGDYFVDSARIILESSFKSYYHTTSLDFPQICKRILSLSGDDLLKEISAKQSDKYEIFVEGFKDIKEQQLADIKQGLDNSIALFGANENISKILKRGGVSASDIFNRSIYLNIDQPLYRQYLPFTRIVISQIFSVISERPNYELPHIICALDEFPLLQMDISEELSTFRKKLTRIICICQNFTQVDEKLGQTMRKIILNLCAYKVVLSADDVESQRYFSDFAGEITVKRKSTTKQPNLKTGEVKESYTESEQREKLIYPEEFGTSDKHLYLFYPKGVVKLKKYFPYKDKGYYRREKRKADKRKRKEQDKSARKLDRTMNQKERAVKRDELIEEYHGDIIRHITPEAEAEERRNAEYQNMMNKYQQEKGVSEPQPIMKQNIIKLNKPEPKVLKLKLNKTEPNAKKNDNTDI